MAARNKTWTATVQEEVEDWDWESELYVHEMIIQTLVSKNNAAEKKTNKKNTQNTATRGLSWLQRVGAMKPQQAAEEWARQQSCYEVLHPKK
jgi:hypothetical protein